VGIREVAREAGVAISSVSRVLAGHPDVSRAMHDRVTAAVERLGYEPDLVAQGLRRRTTMAVGFVIGDISNPLLAEIVTGAERRLRQAGYSMLLTNSEGDPARDAEHLALFKRRRVDGVILSLASERGEATLRALEDLGRPAVLVDRRLHGRSDLDAVLSDHRAGMAAAVGHLLDIGHRRVGAILGQPLRPSHERRRALELTYAERDLSPDFEVREGTFSREWGRAATAELLDGAQRPTALIAGGNQLLIGMLSELAARGLRAGSDISVVTCDDIALNELHDPPIAVIRRDTAALGNVAADLLLRRMNGSDTAGTVVLPTEFVVRPSCAPPPQAATR
jgi:LacI family transcriptional regulator